MRFKGLSSPGWKVSQQGSIYPEIRPTGQLLMLGSGETILVYLIL